MSSHATDLSVYAKSSSSSSNKRANISTIEYFENTKMALSRAHTSAKAADPTKFVSVKQTAGKAYPMTRCVTQPQPTNTVSGGTVHYAACTVHLTVIIPYPNSPNVT